MLKNQKQTIRKFRNISISGSKTAGKGIGKTSTSVLSILLNPYVIMAYCTVVTILTIIENAQTQTDLIYLAKAIIVNLVGIPLLLILGIADILVNGLMIILVVIVNLIVSVLVTIVRLILMFVNVIIAVIVILVVVFILLITNILDFIIIVISAVIKYLLGVIESVFQFVFDIFAWVLNALTGALPNISERIPNPVTGGTLFRLKIAIRDDVRSALSQLWLFEKVGNDLKARQMFEGILTSLISVDISSTQTFLDLMGFESPGDALGLLPNIDIRMSKASLLRPVRIPIIDLMQSFADFMGVDILYNFDSNLTDSVIQFEADISKGLTGRYPTTDINPLDPNLEDLRP